jgi:hypothetical protein
LAAEPSDEHHISLSYNRSFSLNSNAAFFRNAYFTADAKFNATPDLSKDLPDSYTRMWQLTYRYSGVKNGFVELNTFHARKEELIPPPLFAVGDVFIDLDHESSLVQPRAGELRPDVDIDYWGADIRLDLRGGYRITNEQKGAVPGWRVYASASWLSDNFFRGDELDSVLEQFVTTIDAPKLKFRVGYERELSSGTWFSISTRYSGGYDVRYGARSGQVPSHLSLDASISQLLGEKTRLTVTGRNLGDDRHEEFPGVPSVGRYLSARVTHHI